MGNRLFQKINAFIEPPVVDDRISRITGHVKYFKLWSYLSGSAAQFTAAYAGHHDVCEEQIHLLILL